MVMMVLAQLKLSLFLMVTHDGCSRLVSFTVAPARTWGTYEGGLHGESVVWGKLFVGVEFGHKRLEISV